MLDQKEEAIPLLIYDQSTKNFSLSEKGEQILKSIKSPFGVIAVAGMYRTGKSYLLNKMLLNRSNGFSVGPSINPCTKGLWIWSKPILGSNEENNNMPLLLIDTEGFGAFDEDHNHDIRIFTLAILLSSYFIYNSLGNIDENAIQSLSFVINLSKHIQLKSKEKYSSSQPEPEELASLFPSFLWVLRDFSLQLVDDNGEAITAKEYLEKVLENQKTSDEYEQKNKIRKLIRTYFKDRDCHTLVRPLMGEDQLQNLENVPFEKLRPEFMEQVLSLRKKVLSRVKPKLFKSKYLNGEMFINVIKSYIMSINSGMIPNIENTWVSMCKVESHKALEAAEKAYEDFLREKMESMVVNENNFKTIHKEAKDKALEIFKSKGVGEVAIEFEKILRNKIKDKFNYYVQLNEEETKNSLIKLLQKWYSILEYKIHSRELKSLNEIESEFKNIDMKVNEAYSFYKYRNELMNNFKYRVILSTCDFMNSISSNELNLLQNKLNEMTNKFTQEIADSKKTSEKDLERKENQILQLKNDKIEISQKLNNLTENMALLQKDKDQVSQNLTEKLEKLKQELDSKKQELQHKITLAEEKQKDAERRAIMVQSESEKQKILLENKIENLSKQIDDYSKREKDNVHELRSQIKEQQVASKENINKYEIQIRNLSSQNELLKEKCFDLESMLNSKEQQNDHEKSKLEETNMKLSIEIDELKDKLNMLKTKLEQERNRNIEEIKIKENDWISKFSLLKIKHEEIELKFKNSEDNSKAIATKLERENAILLQNNQFLELQIKELNSTIDEQKKSLESILSTFESKSSMQGQEEYTKKIEELKGFFNNEKKQMEENFERSKALYITQIDSLTEKSNELECKAKIEKEEILKELNEVKQKYDRMKRDYENALQEIKNLSENSILSNEDLQKRMKKYTQETEKKLEEKEQKHQKELYDLNKNSEETILQMKSIFDTEKIRFEEKLKDERTKNEKKIKNLTEDYESKIKEIESEYKEEIENLNADLQAEVNNHNDYVSHAENEIGLLQQKIETLKHFLDEARESYSKLQNETALQSEKESENFRKDRAEMQTKIENLISDNNTKDKEITSLNMKKDQLTNKVNEKDELLLAMKKEHDEDKKDLTAKMENYKTKYQESNDDFMMKKLEFIRESALLKQQIEFSEKKIEELNKNIEDNQKRYEEKLFSLRSEVEKDLSDKADRLMKEKEELESKLFAKKKEIKELEQNFNRSINQLEKEKTILSEKLSGVEIQKKEIIDQYEKEIENLNKTYQAMRDEKSLEGSSSYKEIEELRKKVSSLEINLNEKNSELEKEKILFEGKFKFLENQKEQAKKDLSEHQKKFEVLLDTIQKKSMIEKEKLESNHSNFLNSLEAKYTQQIKELTEKSQKTINDLQVANKELERDLKSANIELDLRSKNVSHNDSADRIRELLEFQDKIKKELDETKKDREKKITELQNTIESEKDSLKSKINDLENKIRDFESKRGHMTLEFEKEKAKFNRDRDHLESKVKELQEVIDKQEKKQETLTRENEKLKNEKNASKRTNSQIGRSVFMPNQSKLDTTSKDVNSSYVLNSSQLTSQPFVSNFQSKQTVNLPFSGGKTGFNLDSSIVNIGDSSNNDLNISSGSNTGNISFNKQPNMPFRPRRDDDNLFKK